MVVQGKENVAGMNEAGNWIYLLNRISGNGMSVLSHWEHYHFVTYFFPHKLRIGRLRLQVCLKSKERCKFGLTSLTFLFVDEFWNGFWRMLAQMMLAVCHTQVFQMSL